MMAVAFAAAMLMVACQPAPPALSVVLPPPVREMPVPVPSEPVSESSRPVVFTGSSSIRLWQELPQDFPEWPVLNLGFGGSGIDDLHEQFERVILAPHPGHVVIYSGANDIADKQPPAVVAAKLMELVEKIHRTLPDAHVTYISIALNPARWHQRRKVRAANAAIERFMAAGDRRQFVDVTGAMLGPDGTPREDLFTEDGLHMNRKGYELWIPLIRSALQRASQPGSALTARPGSDPRHAESAG